MKQPEPATLDELLGANAWPSREPDPDEFWALLDENDPDGAVGLFNARYPGAAPRIAMSRRVFEEFRAGVKTP